MKYDIVIGGVGGQGILSIAYVIDNAAMKQGLHFKQSEVHGMAQRGGAVSSHLRLSDQEIFSDLVARRSADLLLSVEPMEALRHASFLRPGGLVVTSTQTMVNIPDYPDVDELLAELSGIGETILLNADRIAREAGSPRAQNMVVLGAASADIPILPEIMKEFLLQLFQKKGERIIQANLNAFEYGLSSGRFYRTCIQAGAQRSRLLALLDHLDPSTLDIEAAIPWTRVMESTWFEPLQALWPAGLSRTIPGDPAIPERILAEGPGFLGQT
ncbi:MAG: indolepyruvate oxidoreductase subunit beta [Bradymonadales bacterium]|nr:indolepyruvate oxidoreductase subunit beta [Bradymonadales bacterium]